MTPDTKENAKRDRHILSILKSHKRLSTSRLAGMLGLNYTYATRVLERLLEDKKVLKHPETTATYWEAA